MLKSIIVILGGIIVSLVGVIVSITENLSTNIYWVGLGLIIAGIVICAVSITGKIKNWF
jgi:hypothetical protein